MLKNSKIFWVFVVIVVGIVSYAFYQQERAKQMSMEELFPEEQVLPVDIQYTFNDGEEEPGTVVADDGMNAESSPVMGETDGVPLPPLPDLPRRAPPPAAPPPPTRVV